MKKSPTLAHHEYTATVRTSHVHPPVGRFSMATWTSFPTDQQFVIKIKYSSTSAIAALNRIHRIMQRTTFREKNDKGRITKRWKYQPNDYILVELRHPGTGAYDLPGGPNPIVPPLKRRTPEERSEEKLIRDQRQKHGLPA